MRILLVIVYLLSRLPLRVLYAISDAMFWINHLFIRYRESVVMSNLKHSFPNVEAQELQRIKRNFFRNFFDYLVEMLKSLTVTETELRVRMQHLNQELFWEAKKEGKNIIFLAGHIFNWEWISALAKVLPHEYCHPVYRKASSGFWDEQIIKIRNRFGNQSIEAQDVIRHILRTPNDGNSAYMFVADQSPYQHSVDLGLDFMNQLTPVFIGYDRLATRMDLAFIYCDIKKVKRGYYQVNYHRILPEGERFETYEVVRKFYHMLENTIHKAPDNYLWSHRRWKYVEYIKNRISK